MDGELLILSLVNGILGRMYLSGYLNRMSAAQVAMITEAVTAQREVLAVIERSAPVWPLGLPAWDDRWVALGLAHDEVLRLSVWALPGADASQALPLPRFRGRAVSVAPLFPRERRGWTWSWDADRAVLTVDTAGVVPSARVLRITPA
jgi:alpha-galactosidase